MTAATIIAAVALAKVLLAILAVRQGRLPKNSSLSLSDSDQGEDFNLGCGSRQLEASPTGNLPSEDYSSAVGSMQATGDFRDPVDDYHHDSFDQPESPSMFDTSDR